MSPHSLSMSHNMVGRALRGKGCPGPLDTPSQICFVLVSSAPLGWPWSHCHSLHGQYCDSQVLAPSKEEQEWKSQIPIVERREAICRPWGQGSSVLIMVECKKPSRETLKGRIQSALQQDVKSEHRHSSTHHPGCWHSHTVGCSAEHRWLHLSSRRCWY